MGQGQNEVARHHVDTGISIGSWVLLQNAHVSIEFLSNLEAKMARLETIESEFRLWITSLPDPAFPLGMLQKSIKIANETPRGVRASLKRSYAALSQVCSCLRACMRVYARAGKCVRACVFGCPKRGVIEVPSDQWFLMPLSNNFALCSHGNILRLGFWGRSSSDGS